MSLTPPPPRLEGVRIRRTVEKRRGGVVIVGHRCAGFDYLESFEWGDQGLCLDELMYGWDLALFIDPAVQQYETVESFLDWVLWGQSNGPFIPSLPADWFGTFDHHIRVEADGAYTWFGVPDAVGAFDTEYEFGFLQDGYRVHLNGAVFEGTQMIQQWSAPEGQLWE